MRTVVSPIRTLSPTPDAEPGQQRALGHGTADRAGASASGMGGSSSTVPASG